MQIEAGKCYITNAGYMVYITEGPENDPINGHYEGFLLEITPSFDVYATLTFRSDGTSVCGRDYSIHEQSKPLFGPVLVGNVYQTISGTQIQMTENFENSLHIKGVVLYASPHDKKHGIFEIGDVITFLQNGQAVSKLVGGDSMFLARNITQDQNNLMDGMKPKQTEKQDRRVMIVPTDVNGIMGEDVVYRIKSVNGDVAIINIDEGIEYDDWSSISESIRDALVQMNIIKVSNEETTGKRG